jgi:hypothetical protein
MRESVTGDPLARIYKELAVWSHTCRLAGEEKLCANSDLQCDVIFAWPLRAQFLRCRAPRPSRLKCLIGSASGFRLCLSWYIVAADEEDSGIHRDKLPDRSFRCRHIGGISRNGTTLRQYLRIGLDVRTESDFNDVVDSIGSQSPESFCQPFTSDENLVCPCSRRDFFVAFGAARSDYSRSCSMRELNSASPHSTSTPLHENGPPLDRTRDMNGAVSGDAGNAEAGTLFQGHTCR